MIQKIIDFINREHVKILVTIIIFLIAFVALLEYSTVNGKSVIDILIGAIKNIFS